MMVGLAAILLLLFRAIRNLGEIFYLWKLGIKRGGFYAVRVWGARLKPLIILLMIDTIVVLTLIFNLSVRIQLF
ncbi:hypothetical protein IAE30_04960 [Pantoea sp. S61]|uniref:hypothetical protein n=1 Tax=Pantoea sp. S61 TaxID=2767442 RepID=UPI00190BFD4E|nr:hypothetical protein [Pantoea sp. S61]MBK0122204.1 hypothetical protein [Pantoea sp. S61]MBK0123087.1 hypothetical protein [Pantoea sp. S61]